MFARKSPHQDLVLLLTDPLRQQVFIPETQSGCFSIRIFDVRAEEKATVKEV